MAFQQRAPQQQSEEGAFSSFVVDQTAYGLWAFTDNELTGSASAEAIYPHIAISVDVPLQPSADVYHVASRPSGDTAGFTNEIFYWRRIGDFPQVWEGPIVIDVTAGTYNHHVATDPGTGKVAIIYERDQDVPGNLLQVCYLESQTNGFDWIGSGTPIFPAPVESVVGGRQIVTNYSDLNGPQAWLECAGEYDLDGRLHIVWVEQLVADISSDCRIVHWDDLSAIPATVVQAVDFLNVGDDGARDLWLSYPQLGFGDGSTLCTDGPVNPGAVGQTSNRDYVYLTYQQYGGPTLTEGNDVSLDSIQNLEIYLTVSSDHGTTWARPINLTQTKTPGCSGYVTEECASEREPSIALTINDTIHIMYVLDVSAGDIVFGQGIWNFNPVMYHRIPGGTDSRPICPLIESQVEAYLADDTVCGSYHAMFTPPGTDAETLTVGNSGNGTLSGSISVSPAGADWLQVATGGFSILPGGPDDVWQIHMDASDPSITGEGLYQAQIEITHNDTATQSPIVFQFNFLVQDSLYCVHQADFDTSSAVDAVDLAIEIDVVFFGEIDPQDQCCPVTRGDFDCNGATDSVDLASLIDYVFFGGLGPCNPFGP